MDSIIPGFPNQTKVWVNYLHRCVNLQCANGNCVTVHQRRERKIDCPYTERRQGKQDPRMRVGTLKVGTIRGKARELVDMVQKW